MSLPPRWLGKPSPDHGDGVILAVVMLVVVGDQKGCNFTEMFGKRGKMPEAKLTFELRSRLEAWWQESWYFRNFGLLPLWEIQPRLKSCKAEKLETRRRSENAAEASIPSGCLEHLDDKHLHTFFEMTETAAAVPGAVTS